MLATFLGEQEQVPPMHSALKFEGKRLYELARRGESVERAARRIVIHRIARVRLGGDELEFDVYCSKGTYIRTLAADIAARLGTLGYVAALRRLSLDPFGDLPMYTLEQLAALQPPEARDAVLLPADLAFLDLPRVELAPQAVEGLLQGRRSRRCSRRLRASCGPMTAQGRFLGHGAGCSRTGGSGRCGCSSTSAAAAARSPDLRLIPRFCLRLSAARVQCAALKTATQITGLRPRAED